jgi:hypothetical protein
MSFRARALSSLSAGVLVGLLCVFAGDGARAEDKAALKKIGSLNAQAMTAYKSGKFQQAKDKLLEAVVLGKEHDLGEHQAIARTYVNLGVVHVEGLMDEERGVRYFSTAQRIRPDIKLDKDLTTDAVGGAFERARADSQATNAAATEEEAATAEAAGVPAKEREKDKEPARSAAREPAPAPAPRLSASDGEKLQRLLEQAEDEKKRLGETHQAAMGRWEKEKLELEKQLLEARAGEKREREAREKLEKERDKERAERDKLLADTRDKLEKEKAEKAERDKLLAEAKEREKKEREARDKLDKEREKEKAAQDKLLAEAKEREKKEREARDKLDKEKQAAADRDRERREKDERERAERERLADGPDYPASLPAALHCPIPEGESGSDLFIHCATQGQVKAKEIALYYRSSGMLHYNSLTMRRSKKGWQFAAVPADKIKGNTVQYYAHALGPNGEVVASNGKPKSPNIALIRPRGLRVAGGPDTSDGGLTKAAARGKGTKRGKK